MRGKVRVRLPGARRFAALSAARQIPVGSLVDTRRGRVALTTAADGHGATQRAEFFAGMFQIVQRRARRPVTELRLRGGSFGRRACGRSGRLARSAARRRSVRRLWGNGRGRFRTRGRGAAATVRGTRWLVEDRCTGTVVRVRRGKVIVRDFGRRRSVRLGASKRYWAPVRR